MIYLIASSVPAIPVPTSEALTLAGQLQWFIYGFGFGSVIAAVAVMIRLFRGVGGGGTFEN
jgi:hypothetical protein